MQPLHLNYIKNYSKDSRTILLENPLSTTNSMSENRSMVGTRSANNPEVNKVADTQFINFKKEIEEELDKVIKPGADKETTYTQEHIKKFLEIMTEKLQLNTASAEEVQDLFRELDLNGNGKLSKEEIQVFKNYIKGIIIANYQLKNTAAFEIKKDGNSGSRKSHGTGSRTN